MLRLSSFFVVAVLVTVLTYPVDQAVAGGKGGKGGGGNSGGGSGGRSSGGRSGGSLGGGSFKSRPSGGFSQGNKNGGFNNRVVKSPLGNSNNGGQNNGNSRIGLPKNGGFVDKAKQPKLGDVVKKPEGGIKRPPIQDVVGNKKSLPKPIKPFPVPGHHDHAHHDHHDHHGGHHDNHNGHHDHHHGHHHHGHHGDHHGGFCFTLPLFPSVVREEVVVVEEVVVPAAPTVPAPAAPVDPAATDAAKQAAADAAAKALGKSQADDKLPTVPVGATLTLEGQIGEKQGQVALQIGQLSIPATMVKWDGKSTTVTLPAMTLAEATTAQIHVFTAESKLVSSLSVQLVPATATDAATTETAKEAPADDSKQAGEPTAGQSQVANN
jgi:hypothetical protein